MQLKIKKKKKKTRKLNVPTTIKSESTVDEAFLITWCHEG